MSKWNNKIVVACIFLIAICICAFMFIYYGNKNKDFEYNKHLSDRVLTLTSVNGDSVDINLQEMAYFIINVEGDINSMAYQYDNEHPNRYWLLRVEAAYDMKDYAKDLAFDTCVRNYIYYMEALEAGFELTDAELKLASDDTRRIMKNLTGKQMDLSDFNEDNLFRLQKKLYLATKYVNNLTQEGYSIKDLELKGEYYQELLKNYDIDTNNEVWDLVVLGNLSIAN